MTQMLPFAVVVLAAIALVVLELLKTFGRDVLEALRNRWSWLMIAVNAIVAVLVYVAVRAVFNTGDSLGTALFVGLAFPILLRSRFTYFRAVGAKEDDQLSTISLKVDEAYSALQDLCWESVDNALAEKRVTLAEKLSGRFSADHLAERIEHHIEARHIESNKARDRDRLGNIRRIDEAAERAYHLALMLIDVNRAQAERLMRKRRSD